MRCRGSFGIALPSFFPELEIGRVPGAGVAFLGFFLELEAGRGSGELGKGPDRSTAETGRELPRKDLAGLLG